MPDKFVAPIEMLGINAIQLAHTLRQIRFHRFNEQMIMIAHLAETVHDKMVPLADQGVPLARQGDRYRPGKWCHAGRRAK